MKKNKLLTLFFSSEKSGGLVLILCTLFSLIVANNFLGEQYHHFWQFNLAGHPFEYWINDGLMAIFFLLIGLELEREIYLGELSSIKNALLPICGALGGMLIPAAIFLFFNFGLPTQSGAGIPMATDIAFALGVLSLLGKKVPVSLKVFLTALAVIDDLGAILVIAFFYTKTLLWKNLVIALSIWVFLFVLGKFKIRNLIPYLIGGVAMWYFMLHSGIHATITGVLLAFAIPFGNGGKSATSVILQNFLHWPVSFIILPLFALANTAIFLNGNALISLKENYSIGVSMGLIIGKPLGIFTFAFLATKMKLCKLPPDLSWKNILGVGFLGGIGFTMSIFITLLAYEDTVQIDNTKLTILLSSLVAGLVGFFVLKKSLKS